MNENFLINTFNEKVLKVNFSLFYFRVTLCLLKFRYSWYEAILELFTCFALYRALKQKNSYLLAVYIAFGLFAILFSWIGLIKKLQSQDFFLYYNSEDLYYMAISNISVILYIVVLYFLFLAYQEIENFGEDKVNKEIFSNETIGKKQIYEIPALKNQKMGSILPFSNNKI